MSPSSTGCFELLLLILFSYRTCALENITRCNLSQPFESFTKLNASCQEYYGPIKLQKGVKEIKFDLTKVHNFSTEGCIQIENTEIEDISFLYAFSNFRLIPNCTQFVRGNKKLCARNLECLNEFFRSIQFYNNSDRSCNDCVGGTVSDYYLEKSTNCVTIHGDLIINGFRGIPPSFVQFRSIETIDGRLIISNNTGFGKFDYFASLKNVGRSGYGVAVVVRDNADLRYLSFPNLQDIKLKAGAEQVELANNPMLEYVEEAATVIPIAATTYTKIIKFGGSSVAIVVEEKLSGSDSKRDSPSHSDEHDNTMLVIGVAVVVLVLILLCALAAYFLHSRRRSTMRPPAPKFKLSKKSGKKLASLCAGILTGNPMIWFTEDLKILWKQTRCEAKQDKHLPSNHVDFVKKKLIPLTNNGRILRRKSDVRYKSLQQRVQKVLQYDLIIVIASKNDVSEVVFCLSKNIGDISVYEDEQSKATLTFKLLNITQFSTNLALYNYEVKDVNKNTFRSKEVLMYQWPADRLPTDFQDLLRIVSASRRRKAICTSNRRKEAFSLFYLLHECVIAGVGPQSIVEVFQLHSQFCNGAPLDRHEMLYIMRILLYWATSAKCLPTASSRQSVQWCQTYDQMAGIYRKYKNIMTIHPQELGHVECYEEVKCGIDAARIKNVNLSERPFAPIKDRYRKKTPEEIKKEMNEAMQSAYGKTIEVSPTADVSTFANVSANINLSKTIEQEMVKSICNTVTR